MKMTEMARLTALLARIARDAPGDRPHPRVEETLDLRAGACTYDLYQPRRELRGLLIAVHGVTLQGNRDHRLIGFARALARAQVACVTPRLPGLASGQWRAADIDALVAVVEAASSALDRPPALVGFSFGGSYALVAAARPALARRVRFVVTFGAYHALDELFQGYVERQEMTPASAAEEENWIYLHLILAHQHGEEAGLAPEVRAAATALLQRYCHEATDEEKRRFYHDHLQGRGLIALGARRTDPAVLAALSPAGQLQGLTATVRLIHDQQDTLVPPSQGEQLHREVAEALGPERGQLLVTPLLSHVSLGDLLRPGAIGQLLRALAPLVEGW